MNIIEKLRILLVFGILGFLYDGYEAWPSIIGGIKKKLKGTKNR